MLVNFLAAYFASLFNTFKVHTNPSRFLVLCKEDEKLASKLFYSFDLAHLCLR